MKTYVFIFFVLIYLLFHSCEDDTMDPMPPEVIEPSDTTLTLQPHRYVVGDTADGIATAIWQDSFLWEATGVGLYQDWHTTDPDSYYQIYFRTFQAGTGFLREGLIMTEIPLNELGVFKISGDTKDLDDGFVGAKLLTSQDGGDVLEDVYDLDETAEDNELTISEIDTVNQIYWGMFTVSFNINTDREKVNPDNPDHVKIKEAEFWVRIIE